MQMGLRTYKRDVVILFVFRVFNILKIMSNSPIYICYINWTVAYVKIYSGKRM